MKVEHSEYCNEDLAPVPAEKRHWRTGNYVALWISMSLCIPTYMLASSLIEGGMNWWQAIFTIFLGNFIVLIPMVLNGKAGSKYGIPFPVLARASFGVRGANIPALLRALVACGWFGIQTWIGGHALYQGLALWFPTLSQLPAIFPPSWNLATGPAISFFLFWLLNMFVVYKGVESIRKLLVFKAIFLPLAAFGLLAWAMVTANGLGPILDQPGKLLTPSAFFAYFFPALTGMVGFWATLSLNIPDFTRYAVSDRAQVLGQSIGLPLSMTLFSWVGVVVTSATTIIYGSTIWDPLVLTGKFQSPLLVTLAMISVAVSTLATNIAANIVGPANDFANLNPRKISFRLGGFITGFLGILICPWKLIADPNGFIFTWLIAYSSLLGPIGGIMIIDYFFIRHQQLDIQDLYHPHGRYWYTNGFNFKAVAAIVLGVLPSIPGFLTTINLLPPTTFWPWVIQLYHYAWFVGFAVSALIYLLLMKTPATHLTPAFDDIAQDYQDSKQLPFRIYSEKFTLFKLLGDLKGKAVLDLACGEGIYARQMMGRGARRVVGMDISPNMIELAKKAEAERPYGGNFLVGDAREVNKVGDFDVVLAAYLLNYAKSGDHLMDFLKNIYGNLQPGGRLVGINDNPANPLEYYSTYRKYGFIKSVQESVQQIELNQAPIERVEGSAVTYTIFHQDGHHFAFDNFYLKPETYEQVFKEVGFKEFQWHQVEVSEEGMKSFGENYWNEYLANPPLICFTAVK